MQCQKRKFGDDLPVPCKELDSSGDGILRTEDGSKFKINRNLLARQCPFFKALFGCDFGDGKDVLLKGIDSETLESILVYLYTETIQLNEENATDILVASDYLLIDPLLEKSKLFVLKEMTPTNCIPLFLAAWQIERLNILNNCHRFIVIHFEEIVSQSEEISSIPLEAMKKILKEKSLNVSDERTVWNVIVRWIKFDFQDRFRFVPELLRYISLKDADEPLMNDIIFHSLIQGNSFCQELIFDELQHKDYLQNFRQILNSQNSMTESRIPTNVHLIVHSSMTYNGLSEQIYLTWDGEIDYWRKVGSIHFFPDYIIQLDRYVYMFKTSLRAYLSLAFAMFQEKCLPMTPIYRNRRYYSVVSVNGFIYVMGGIDGDFKYIEDNEIFDPRTWKWKLVSRMVPMSLSKAVALNGYIYAIGYDREETSIIVQVYDPASDRWSAVSKPTLFKPVILAIAYREHLYVIGGESFSCVQRRVEEYDPVKDVWIPMPNLPFIYFTPRAIVLNDVFIIYEDNLSRKYLANKTSPVYWDSRNRTWHIIQESSPLHMIHMFKFCTITEANVVKDLVKRNRQQNKRWVKSPLA
ncbi:Kelch-like protein 10 [Araneus ventricosus]|uniref:Kelch-like protein diablo n=1 Tax=Araneus ventricosus TaxID=182803 RepID=A0A4Y2VKU9_ARAVE|nr:Kelch-like protein 10 [Araneus ventricosus]GBO25963.1 Kelch-like protein 10 [Araneus ventricosus]